MFAASRKFLTPQVSRSSGQKFHPRMIRCLHAMPRIDLLETLQQENKGIPGLYSPETLQQNWFQYQNYLLQKLDTLTEDTVYSTQTVREIVALTGKKTGEEYDINRIASELLNNETFFRQFRRDIPDSQNSRISAPGPEELLRGPETELSFSNEPAGKLREWISYSFGSVAEFRQLLLSSAMAIQGNGYVWLLAEADTDYSSGSLLANGGANQYDSPELHKYRRLVVVNTFNAGSPEDVIRGGQALQVGGAVNSFASTTDEENARLLQFAKGHLAPLLAVKVWQHSYLADYGVFGKRKYLENLWDVIDWTVVESRLPVEDLTVSDKIRF